MESFVRLDFVVHSLVLDMEGGKHHNIEVLRTYFICGCNAKIQGFQLHIWIGLSLIKICGIPLERLHIHRMQSKIIFRFWEG